MNNARKAIAYKLKTIRDVRQLTQQQLADMAGINVGQISHYETGHSRPSLDNLVKLSKALSVSVQWLVEAE